MTSVQVIHYKPPPSTPHDPIITDDLWILGEFQLISSDGVRFWLPLEDFMSLSPIFRDAAELASGGNAEQIVRFTDPDFERADVIRLFLELTYNMKGYIPDIAFKFECEHVIFPVIQFVNKWECFAYLEPVRLNLSQVIINGAVCRPFHMFITLSHLGSTYDDLLRLLVGYYSTWTWQQEFSEECEVNHWFRRNILYADMRFVLDEGIWDVNLWPVTITSQVPPRYTALLRTSWAMSRLTGYGSERSLFTSFGDLLHKAAPVPSK